MRIVVALGGNALLRRGERPDADVQTANIDRVATAVAALAIDHEVVLTHGNGPQIGLLAVESATDPALSAPYPLDLLGAQTQGMIGSLLLRALYDTLPGHRIAALVTHTLVRAGDPAFLRPTKFVGQTYSREAAGRLARRHGWRVAEDTTGWRRVVASPAPVGVVETDTIHELLSGGTLVICAGGGGVPVVADPDTGALTGVEAVVDKDLTAALLAEDLKADFLLVLTDVPHVYADYGTPRQHPLHDATPTTLRHGHFAAGSMGPKTEAAARFVERTGGLAAIGSLDAAYEMLHGRAGTLVRPDLPVVG
ncbi:carbamate kinase [Streptomyces sp. SAI-208]|jgi:carbamate kinase|uniref:carbamate kinase n=1 Tax=unclassified Streptomyces TaxID=2593676 RepID=UPI00247453D6|nr:MULTISPECIES: carbamate kinase [unclassified Streptomyces]MDH6514804.1 carbamate kinase [Streptomyces sp. SAI-090]MDH6546986.1 carbamate kinase [Streptomyces sp. SAI-041]MDH6566098.1 carbamate kinase [Streptomyces sp. SAI-117]MDH6588994.1 carbamate kinase [Streptomyces sp. SAI-133]MDH6605651.1 carbamate kinase [Streptomyces sp. SAI-208]